MTLYWYLSVFFRHSAKSVYILSTRCTLWILFSPPIFHKPGRRRRWNLLSYSCSLNICFFGMPFKISIFWNRAYFHLVPSATRRASRGDRWSFLWGVHPLLPWVPLQEPADPPPSYLPYIYLQLLQEKETGTRPTWPHSGRRLRIGPLATPGPAGHVIWWPRGEHRFLFSSRWFLRIGCCRSDAHFTCCWSKLVFWASVLPRNSPLSMVVFSSRIMRCTQSRFPDFLFHYSWMSLCLYRVSFGNLKNVSTVTGTVTPGLYFSVKVVCVRYSRFRWGLCSRKSFGLRLPLHFSKL